MTEDALAALLAKRELVEQVLGHAVLGGAHAAQVGHPVAKLLDGLHLLIQVVSFNEIAHL